MVTVSHQKSPQPPDRDPLLKQLLGENLPATVLLVGPTANAGWKRLAPCSEARVTLIERPVDRPLPPNLGRFDLVFVAGALEHLDVGAGRSLLSALRDLHANTLLVEIDHRSDNIATEWNFGGMLSFGFERIPTPPAGDTPVERYRFNLFDYKMTPDWLNARFWAHPETWQP